jgi:hypothetical protein
VPIDRVAALKNVEDDPRGWNTANLLGDRSALDAAAAKGNDGSEQ